MILIDETSDGAVLGDRQRGKRRLEQDPTCHRHPARGWPLPQRWGSNFFIIFRWNENLFQDILEKRKPRRFPLGAQWASILATVCLFQKQLLILTPAKRFLFLILLVCRNWLHYQGPCLWNWPGRRPPWLQGPSVQVTQSDLWTNENWKKC